MLLVNAFCPADISLYTYIQHKKRGPESHGEAQERRRREIPNNQDKV